MDRQSQRARSYARCASRARTRSRSSSRSATSLSQQTGIPKRVGDQIVLGSKYHNPDNGKWQATPFNPFVGLWQTAHNLRVIDLKKNTNDWSITVKPYVHLKPITVPLEGPQCELYLKYYFLVQYGSWETDPKILDKLKRHARLDCEWTENREGKLEIQSLRWPLSNRSSPGIRWFERLILVTEDLSKISDLAAKGVAANAHKDYPRQTLAEWWSGSFR